MSARRETAASSARSTSAGRNRTDARYSSGSSSLELGSLRFYQVVPRSPGEWDQAGRRRRLSFKFAGAVSAAIFILAGLWASETAKGFGLAGTYLGAIASYMWIRGTFLSKADIASMTSQQADARGSAGAYWEQSAQDARVIAQLLIAGFALQLVAQIW